MSYEVILMRVMHRTGLEDKILVQEMVHRVVAGLGNCLNEGEVEEIAEGLMEPLRSHLEENWEGRCRGLDQLYREVSEEMGVDISFGLEVCQVVLQVMGETVGRKGREALRRALPEEWHPLFEPRGKVERPLRTRERRSLSEGKAGSIRPLSEGRPGHRNSIALSDEPHGGEQVATSRGKPGRRTLSEGKPGSSRPLSEG